MNRDCHVFTFLALQDKSSVDVTTNENGTLLSVCNQCMCVYVHVFTCVFAYMCLYVFVYICVFVCVLLYGLHCILGERIVTVGGVGCPCGGTHVKNVADIREMRVTKIKKVCGMSCHNTVHRTPYYTHLS